ncbi:MAG: hypothetical protein U1F71_02775 [Verrucomicrobiaceae bacterium]
MRRFADYLVLLAVLSAVGSCSHREDSAPPVFNPMDSLWSGVRAEIDELEDSHAKYSEWVNRAEEAKVLDVERDIRDSLKGTNLTESEIVLILSKRTQFTRTALFGFEGNFHALVIFGNDNRSIHVVKW